MPTLTSAQLATAATYLHANYADSDIAGYYTYLASLGVSYGTLALGVVQNNTAEGEVANAYAASVALSSGIDMSVGSDIWKQAVFNIASGDLAVRNFNSGADLTWEQYDTVHTAAYDPLGLPAETWTAHTPLQNLNTEDPALATAEWNGILSGTNSPTDIFLDGWSLSAAGMIVNPIQTPTNVTHDIGESALYTANMAVALYTVGDTTVESIIPATNTAFWTSFDNLKSELSTEFGANTPVVQPWINGLVDPDIDPTRALATAVADALSQFGTAEVQSSPLVIDLSSGHTGITLTTFDAATTSTFFDIDGTGFASQTAWTSGSTTGFLVDDLNANGKIDSVSEMFGSSTVDGFAQLATLDSNHDLKIDSNDTAWSSLQVWIDANGNGVTDSGELHSLASLGIVSIDLAGVAASTSTQDGNTISHTSTVTFSGGATAAIDDVWFTHSTTNTDYNGGYTLDPGTLFLPDLRGYGTLPDLDIAMSQDATLKGLVADFTSSFSFSAFADPSTLDSSVDAILHRWAGVDGVATDSRGPNVNAQDLEFLERLFGQPYAQEGMSDPATNAGQVAEVSFHTVADSFKADLLIQSGAEALFDGPVTYNPWTGAIEGTVHLSETAISDLSAYAPGTEAGAEAYWVSIADFIDNTEGIANLTTDEHSWLNSAVTATTIVTWDDIISAYDSLNPGITVTGTSGNDTLTGGTGNDTIYGESGNDTINAGAGNDTINLGTTGTSVVHGGDGDDTINAISGNNTLYGDGGNDNIYGGSGNDTIYGGTGGNNLYGGSGTNTYVFGGGDDVIHSGGSGDKIVLPSGIDLSDLTFTRIPTENSTTAFNDLLITVSTGGSIQIENHFAGSSNEVGSIVFNDSSTLDLTAITGYTTVLSSGDDYYSPGINIDQVVNGMDGNDVIVTGSGNDTLNGGNGNDQLTGGTGNDTYIASPGFDTISDSGGADKIVVPVGYSIDDVTFSRHIGVSGPDNDLIIDIHGLGEIRVANQFYTSSDVVETLNFLGDDSSVTLTDQIIQTIGTSGNDYLTGLTSGVAGNLFDGRGGSDHYTSGIGNNTYVIAAGFGNDVISEPYHSGTNVIDFTGVDPANIRMWTNSSGYLMLQDTTDPSHSITIYAGITGSGQDENAVGQYVEQINFDDSSHTVWDLTGGLNITGDNSGDYLYGTAYGDTIIGGTGNDTIYGNGGDDTIIGGGGTNNLNGGTGNDTYLFASGFGNNTVSDTTSAASNVIHFTGIDPSDIRMWTDTSGYLHLQDTTNASYSITVYAGTTGSGQYESNVGQYFSQVTFDDSGHTAWNLTGGLNITGDNSGDYLYGTAYGDTITGGTGNDTIYGNGGDDTIIGGGGTNNLNGGSGNDTYIFASGFGNNTVNDTTASASNVIHFTGIDPNDIRIWTDTSGYLHLQDTTNASYSITVYAGTTGTGQYESNVGQYFSHVTFDDVAHTTWDLTGGLTLTGTSSSENLYGTAYDDTINGMGGSDTIYGNDGNDTLNGGSSADNLSGGNGDDILYGAGGNDYLTGGAGADTFLFKGATAFTGSATIADFNTSQGDKIDISDVLHGNYDPLTDAISDFVQLTASGSNTLLKVDIDGIGTGHTPTTIATIQGVTGFDLATLISDHHLIVTS